MLRPYICSPPGGACFGPSGELCIVVLCPLRCSFFAQIMARSTQGRVIQNVDSVGLRVGGRLGISGNVCIRDETSFFGSEAELVLPGIDGDTKHRTQISVRASARRTTT